MFSGANAFASLENESDEEGGVGWAPSQTVWATVGLGEEPAETVARPTAGTSCRRAPAVPVATGTAGTTGDASLGVARRLPARTGDKRKYPSGSRAQGSLQWAVSVPDDKNIPALFVVGKKLADTQTGRKLADIGSKTANKQLIDEVVPVCVPVWPLYKLSFEASGFVGPALGDRTWIHFCHREQWCQTLRAAVGLPGRGHGFGSEIEDSQLLFKKAIKAARKNGNQRHAMNPSRANVLVDSDEEQHDEESSDDEESSRVPRRMTFHMHPVLRVTVKGVSLCVLNTLRPLAFEMSDSGVQFLKQVVLPELQTKARTHSGSQPVTPVKIAPFHFDENTLNDPTRVCWHPTSRSYKLVLKGKGSAHLSDSTDLAGKPLVVDATLTGDAFLTAKAAVYRRACEAWNERDTSTKERITTSASSEGSQESPHRGSDTSAGSQPVDSS